MRTLFSTSKLSDHVINEIIIKSVHSHATKNGELTLVCKDDYFSKKVLVKNLSPSILLLLLEGLWVSLVQPKMMSSLKFDSLCIGRYAVAAAYRSYDSYVSRFTLSVEYVKALAKCALYSQGIKLKLPDIEAAYLDNPFYHNGIFYDIFSRSGVPIYHNEYPFGLVRREPTSFGSYEDALQVPHEELSEKEISKGKKQLESVTRDTSKIPYMLIEFDKLRSSKKYDFVIYSHSFTDAQSSYGFDGAFNNIKEWLEFTLHELRAFKVCVKAHPEIYTEGYTSQVVAWDRKLFTEVVERYKGYENFDFIDYPVKNIDLLNSIDISTVLVSHHSNALLEGGLLGFKCIAARSGNWINFEIFNEWSNIQNYSSLLLSPINDLQFTNQSDLCKYYYSLYYGEGSYFSPKWWVRTVAELCAVGVNEIVKDPEVINGMAPEIVAECVKRISDEMVTM